MLAALQASSGPFSRHRGLSAVAAVLLLTACANNATPVQPRTFDRPEHVAFACYDRTSTNFVPIASCDDVELDGSSEDFALIALVTQNAQGEVAAVDLDEQVVLDADVRVPGFTFVLVGENPTAIVVPTLTAKHAYVANQTSRTVSWLPLAQFHPEAAATSDLRGELALPGSPSDMVLSPSEDFLYVALPDNGTIGEIAVDATNPTAPLTFVREIPLDASLPTPVAEVADDVRYGRYCPEGSEDGIPRPMIGAPRVPAQLGASPRPVHLAVDPFATPPVLLVADANLPRIHRLALVAAGADPALLAALAPAVPTREVVVTPPVPATLGERSATQRYVYAIDALDNSLLAMEYTDSSVNFGAVLTVNTSHEAQDRIDTGTGVARLQIITPEYSVTGGMAPEECDPAVGADAEAATARTLRGVFLAAGQLDGTLAMVDVYDLDAACRGGAGCSEPAQATDVTVRIERHRPRFDNARSRDARLSGSPSLTFDGSPGTIQDDGIATTLSGPRLEPFAACPQGMFRAFPESGTAILCASADPWLLSGADQAWLGVWQGQLPFAQGAGRFDTSAGTTFRTSDGDFCSWGVLGEADVAASMLSTDDPLTGYVGDRIVFTGELSPAIQAALEAGQNSEFERCRPFLDVGERDPVFLEIVEARQGEVVLRAPLRRDVTGVPAAGALPVAYTLDDVTTCFAGVTPFAVHTRAAYVVTSNSASYLHRVIPVGGSCRVDTSLPFDPADPQTRVEGRAFVNRAYINPYVAFHVGARRADGSAITTMEGIESTLGFVMTGLPDRLTLTVGRIVSDVLLTPNGQDMIVIDAANAALRLYNLDPIGSPVLVQ